MSFRINFLASALLAALFVFSVPARAGDVPSQAPQPASPAVAPPAPAAQQAAAPVKKDPCENYKTSYEVYTVCQDRMHKIDLLKAAQAQRDNESKAPVAPAAPAADAAPDAAKTPASPSSAPASSAPSPAAGTAKGQ